MLKGKFCFYLLHHKVFQLSIIYVCELYASISQHPRGTVALAALGALRVQLSPVSLILDGAKEALKDWQFSKATASSKKKKSRNRALKRENEKGVEADGDHASTNVAQSSTAGSGHGSQGNPILKTYSHTVVHRCRESIGAEGRHAFRLVCLSVRPSGYSSLTVGSFVTKFGTQYLCVEVQPFVNIFFQNDRQYVR